MAVRGPYRTFRFYTLCAKRVCEFFSPPCMARLRCAPVLSLPFFSDFYHYRFCVPFFQDTLVRASFPSPRGGLSLAGSGLFCGSVCRRGAWSFIPAATVLAPRRGGSWRRFWVAVGGPFPQCFSWPCRSIPPCVHVFWPTPWDALAIVVLFLLM